MGANFVLGMAQMANPDYTIERWHTCLMAYLLLILAAATNIWGRRALEKLSQVMIIFNILSFVVVIVVILARDNEKRSASFVFKDFQNFSGFGTAYASLLGLLQSAFGMTGYGEQPITLPYCSDKMLRYFRCNGTYDRRDERCSKRCTKSYHLGCMDRRNYRLHFSRGSLFLHRRH